MQSQVYKNNIETEFYVTIEGADITLQNGIEKARIVFANEGWDYDVYSIKDRRPDSIFPKFINFNGTWFIKPDEAEE